MEVDRKTLWGTLAVCVGCIGIYKLALNEDVQAAWSIRHKLWNILTSGKEDRIAYYYTELGDDIRDDFAYNSKRCREVNPDLEEPLWLNVGFWRTAKDYETAGRDMALLLAQTAGLSKGHKVLDVGCGFAEQDILWASKYEVSIQAVDLTPLHIDVAQKRIQTKGLSSLISCSLGNAIKLSSDDDTFDHVTALECAFHFDTREAFFREAFRVLKPGGNLTIADMIPKKGHEINKLLQRLGRWYTSIPSQNMYDASEYSKKLKECGFVNVEIVDISQFCFPGFFYYGTGKQEKVEPVDTLPEDVLATAYLDWYLYSGVEEYVIVKATKPS